MKNSLALSALFLFLIFASCNLFHGPKSPYPGYSTRDGITHYKYCDMSTFERRKFKTGDIGEFSLSYAKMNDSLVFYSTYEKGFPFTVFMPYAKLFNGSTYEKALLHANEGDSITYIVPADSVFRNILKLPLPHFMRQGEMMMVHARIVNIMDSTKYASRLKEIAHVKKDMDINEQVALLHYVADNHIPDSAKHDNIYMITENGGTGPIIKKGDMVSLSYMGSFLNGKVFDTVTLSNPLQFRFGDTAQVIQGLEIAIKRMHEGGKAKIIIPSQLAFGNNGSSTGIVPPYTTVVYEVTLLKVQAL